MAVRGDITVNWLASPRIVTVAAPSTEVTVRDLQDTLRVLEMGVEGILYPPLRECSGDEDLGGGTHVGLTLKLLNAKVAFEARPGPTWVLCTIAGGNLVAEDANGAAMDPRQPTAYVSCDRASSSSGTVQELSAIQFSSFGGAVHLDPTSAHSGTEFPMGTPQAPVNNCADALAIAAVRGIQTLFIVSDATLDTGLDFRGLSVTGRGPLSTHVTISTAAQVDDCHISNVAVSGTLDANAWIEDCEVGDLYYVQGRLIRCAIEGTLTIAGSGALLLDCYSTRLAPSEIGIIDVGGAHNVAIHGYSGHLQIQNMSGGVVGVSFTRGHLTIDSTVSGGMLHVMGDAKVVDNHTGTAVIHRDYVLSPVQIAAEVWQRQIPASPAAGSVEEALANVLAEALGRSAIDTLANTLTLYRLDGTVLRTFSLTPATGVMPSYVQRTPA